MLGIFWKRANKQGAIAGMSIGLAFTFIMIVLMRAQNVIPGMEAPIIDSFMGINAQGIGVVGMLLNFAATIGISLVTAAPPQEVQDMVEEIRYPNEAPAAVDH